MSNWNIKEVRKHSTVWWAFAVTDTGKRYIVKANDGWFPTDNPDDGFTSIKAAKSAWAYKVRESRRGNAMTTCQINDLASVVGFNPYDNECESEGTIDAKCVESYRRGEHDASHGAMGESFYAVCPYHAATLLEWIEDSGVENGDRDYLWFDGESARDWGKSPEQEEEEE